VKIKNAASESRAAVVFCILKMDFLLRLPQSLHREKVQESTQHRLVVRIRPWCRIDWVFAFPGLALTSLVTLYIGLQLQSWWRFLFYLASVYSFGSFVVFFYDVGWETAFVFDKQKG
jgi:hypothetical protein